MNPIEEATTFIAAQEHTPGLDGTLCDCDKCVHVRRLLTTLSIVREDCEIKHPIAYLQGRQDERESIKNSGKIVVDEELLNRILKECLSKEGIAFGTIADIVEVMGLVYPVGKTVTTYEALQAITQGHKERVR